MIRRRLVRSNSSIRGWSTTSWIIVGTSNISVTWCSWTAVRTATGSKDGIITCVPPTICPATPERGDMEHRRGVQAHAAPAHEVLAGEQPEGRGQQAGVAEHHALGPPGGAAGVEDAGELRATAADVLHRLGPGDEVLEGQGAVRDRAVAGVDHVVQPRMRVADSVQ